MRIPEFAPSAPWVEDEFAPSGGQVTFILSRPPTDLEALAFYVNGVKVEDEADYSVSGTNVTWLNTEYAMEATDRVAIKYK